mmetsp:Transcript_98500/g.195383  ORF Transcript_98500/g.195383 Transcript_98500/m.195383 type:complete len:215 (-) Transcript_98500:815-1459(-)
MAQTCQPNSVLSSLANFFFSFFFAGGAGAFFAGALAAASARDGLTLSESTKKTSPRGPGACPRFDSITVLAALAGWILDWGCSCAVAWSGGTGGAGEVSPFSDERSSSAACCSMFCGLVCAVSSSQIFCSCSVTATSSPSISGSLCASSSSAGVKKSRTSSLMTFFCFLTGAATTFCGLAAASSRLASNFVISSLYWFFSLSIASMRFRSTACS